jgi:hypothetical protein
MISSAIARKTIWTLPNLALYDLFCKEKVCCTLAY